MDGRSRFAGVGAVVALGLAAGVMSGLFGIGGGLVIVPVLVLLFAFDQKTATGTSLYAQVWPVGLLGVIEYASRGEVRLDWGAMVAVGIVVGMLLGARMTAPLAPSTMKRLYGVFLLVIGAYFVFFQGEVDPGPASGGFPARAIWLGLGIGGVAGILGGLFGIGGGLIIVPALKLLAGLDPKTAIGTSLFAQVWPVGLLGVLEYRRRAELRAGAGAGIAAGLVLGNLIGAVLTGPLPQATLQRLYGLFCLAVGVYYQQPGPRTIPTPAPVVHPEVDEERPPTDGPPQGMLP